MMTQAQALGDIQYNKVKLTSKPKVKTAYDPPMWPEFRNSRYIGCLMIMMMYMISNDKRLNTILSH